MIDNGPVSATPLPTAFKLPRFRGAVAAARDRAAEVPAGPTLIDMIDEDDWNAPDDSLIMCGK